jgi:hypothetical protein
VPGLGVAAQGVKEANKPSKPPEMYKNGQFPTLIDLKIAENAIFP